MNRGLEENLGDGTFQEAYAEVKVHIECPADLGKPPDLAWYLRRPRHRVPEAVVQHMCLP